MHVKIRKYSTDDYDLFLDLIKTEKEWEAYLDPKFRKALEESNTYVAEKDNRICGFSRSITDSGFMILVIDLLVRKNFRGNAIGKKLLDAILLDFPDQDVYVLSDADPYYEKIGCTKEGSIYKLKR